MLARPPKRSARAWTTSARPWSGTQAIYEAASADLLGLLARLPANAKTVLLVGHNPGLEELLVYLVGDDVGELDDGKLLPTAALARLEMPDDWSDLTPGCAQLVNITLPKTLRKRLGPRREGRRPPPEPFWHAPGGSMRPGPIKTVRPEPVSRLGRYAAAAP